MNPSKLAIREEAARIYAVFREAGAVPVETDILQSSATLLDLYGEDIRARAFVTHDPLGAEQMLRPDFTVPVVQRHMAEGAEPARYTYCGEVFRRQQDGTGRAAEVIQVGYEVFDRSDPAGSDAEVFALISKAISHLKLRAVTGDIGILMAAVNGLATSEPRRAALLRHIWRPRRFRALLDRYSGKTSVPAARKNLLAGKNPLESTGILVGLRTNQEINDRIAALQQDASEPPISEHEVALLDELLNLRNNSPKALQLLKDLAVEVPAISNALSRMARRLDALDQRDIDVSSLDFEVSYGRTSMEYYDGFVFGLYSNNDTDAAPIATGGRYDALTRVLGTGKSIPAVGGVIRPELVLQRQGGEV